MKKKIFPSANIYYLNPFPAYVLYSGYEYGIVVITKHNEGALTNALLKLFT